MSRRILPAPVRAGAVALLLMQASASAPVAAATAGAAAPLAIGDTFTLDSKVLGEVRRINVYRAPGIPDSATPLPVLYMPDGGIAEDFLHVAGLLEVSIGNGTMRPFLLVGIENTRRRRDLTGPTSDPEDRKIAPVVGGSAAFRRFLRDELMPSIRARYHTTAETAIMGESLAGRFVVETLFLEPDLFDTYIAFDPSVWWNRGALVAAPWPRLRPEAPKRLFLAGSRDDRGDQIRHLAERLQRGAPAGLAWSYQPMPEETHATLYHPAALIAVRRLFAPEPAGH